MTLGIAHIHSKKRFSDLEQLDLASELFHGINRIIPADQMVISVPPAMPVRDALSLMGEHNFSQLPVCKGNAVLGVFSLRSLASEIATSNLNDWIRQKCTPGDLPVDEFLEQLEFVRLSDRMATVMNAIERDNAVLVGTPERLVAIITSADMLGYLDKIASPYMLISEIELALRALIRSAMTPEQLNAAADNCFRAVHPRDGKMPVDLDDLTFDNYKSFIEYTNNWKWFEPIFGGSRVRVAGKLKEIGQIRNDLFHFRREATMRDHQTLSVHRDWLLNKVKQSDADRRGKKE